MARLSFPSLLLAGSIAACSPSTYSKFDDGGSANMAAAANIVDAVNMKDAQQYARDLHPDVVVKMYDGEVRLRGRDAIIANREAHFGSNPDARNELVHLAEIDNRVVMHDIVWLDGDTKAEGADIVEVFTFSDGKIVQIDVIQPADLFSARQ